MDDFIKRGFPVHGECAFHDKHIVKKAGGAWDPKVKKWKASNFLVLDELIATGKFEPTNLARHLVPHIIKYWREKKEANDAKTITAAKKNQLTASEIRQRNDKMLGVLPDLEADLETLRTVYGISEEQLAKLADDPTLGTEGGKSRSQRVILAIQTQLEHGAQIFPESFFDHYFSHLPQTKAPHAALDDAECWMLRRAGGIANLITYAKTRIFRARGDTKPLDWDDVVPAIWSENGCPRYRTTAWQLQQRTHTATPEHTVHHDGQEPGL